MASQAGFGWRRKWPAWLAGLAVLAATAAQAQETGCAIKVDVTERQALATVTVVSPCRRDPGQAIKVLYDDNVFLGHFDQDGKASIAFVLTKPTDNEILVVTSEGARVRRSVAAPDFADVYRITMVWQAPVRLRLHVVEPGQRLNQRGDINDTAPNTDGTAGLGRIDLAWAAPEPDAAGEETSAEQSYVLRDIDDRRRGVFTPYFDYPSRGATPEPPFCGNGRLASVPYRLFIIDEGRVSVDVQHESPRAPCGAPLANPQQRIQGLQ